MKHLSIQSVAMPKRKPKDSNTWVRFMKFAHKIEVSSKFKDELFPPKEIKSK